MKNIEYDLPIFVNGDKADLNQYSEKMAKAIKKQIDKFGSPLTFKGTVSNCKELEELKEDSESGEIYRVVEENKNYIFDGNEWQEYSDNIDVNSITKDVAIKYISDEYSATAIYDIDDYCIYNNKLYKCTTTIEIAEEFNVEHWKETTIAKELKNKLDFEVVEEF